MKGVDEGYCTALCICGSPSRVASFMGWCQGCHSCFTLCGDGPVAMAAAKQLISKYYPWPIQREREQGADVTDNTHQITGWLLTGSWGAPWKTLQKWCGIVRVHKKSFEFILGSVLLVDNYPLYIYKSSCTTRPDYLSIYYLSRLWFWKKIVSNYTTSNIFGVYIFWCI